MHILDIDLEPSDVQDLSEADAIAALFARLGYNTDARTLQTPGNLGLTAESTVRPIKRTELIADQDGLLQVYLFELTGVTIAHTRALARAFRNRAGNYLFILTSDYERLDFVLLERYVPEGSATESGLGQRQAGVRPRVLTIDRRKPSAIDLRVLRRLTWTEGDVFAQYDKLLSAYAVAGWSEEFFNNRALFSDYYLLERLRERPEWGEDPKPAYLRLRQLYQGASMQFAGHDRTVLTHQLIEPALQILGFAPRPRRTQGGRASEPDYRLYAPQGGERPDASPMLAVCLVYPWGRFLDGKDDQRDNESPEENPGAVVISLLEKGEAPWAIVTNGKLWRLYAQRTHSRATNYYEIDLEEVLAQAGPQAANIAESFRYFWLFFRRQAFEPVEIEREGKQTSLTWLDQLLLESADYAKDLGERLKDRVFEQVFPHLASGFIASIRAQNGSGADLSPPALQAVFRGTLTLLYRLLFLLYAEARDLLPVKEARGYFEVSLTRLKQEVAEVAGSIADEVEGRLKRQYGADSYALYGRLVHLFAVVDKGEPALNVPVYNGGLFLSDPEADDHSPEAEAGRFVNMTKVPDRLLARALDLLARDVDPKRQDLVFIDYKSLGVRQLGSIYEGLLEFRLRIADRKLAIVKEQGREVYVPFQDLDERRRERAERQEHVISRGEVYLENDKRERKATGSYYTPDHIVQYIVEHTVGPVLQEKFEAMRPKLREAQRQRRAFFERQEAFRKQGLKPEPDSKADLIGRELVEELFDLKILDPAMGSGHFLVEAVDYITDKALDFLNAFPWNPVSAHLARMRQAILQEMEDQGITIDARRLTDVNLLKRHVLKRCIYGVDVNPMAVELAKVSLWLDCFTLGAPLSFLDHHLRCGNSLIGVTVEEVREALEGRPGEPLQFDLFGSRFAGLLLATDLMRRVGDLSDVTSSQVQESRAEYRRASDALAPFKRILDIYTSQWFGNEPVGARRRRAQAEPPAIVLLKAPEAEALISARDDDALQDALEMLPPEFREVAVTALEAAAEKRFFHWELEFPEVFYGPRPGTTQVIERLEGAGFDAVIGNPPYDVLASEELGYDVSRDLQFYQTAWVYEPAIRGKKNLYKLFICRAASLMSAEGAFSFIVPMALLGDDQSAGVRRLLLEKTGLIAIESFPQKDDPHHRVFPEAKLSTAIFVARAKQASQRFNVRTHAGRDMDSSSSILRVAHSEVLAFDPENTAIPSCTQKDWDLVARLLTSKSILRMTEVAKSFQGEVNETNERIKGNMISDPEAPVVLRGSNICLYVVRAASQGEDVRLHVRRFLKGKQKDTKAFAYEYERVGFQRSAPQNNFRRIIAARIPRGSFCFDTISYITEKSTHIDLDLLLALLNSKILDWYFRLGSTNSKVNRGYLDLSLSSL
jgi:hypothetical protein